MDCEGGWEVIHFEECKGSMIWSGYSYVIEREIEWNKESEKIIGKAKSLR